MFIWSNSSSTSNFVRAIPLIPEVLIVCLTSTPSNQPHLLFLEVTVPNSFPLRPKLSPISSLNSVGKGPFPTELENDIGELIGIKGKEFGTVTSRKRRCGWFDGVLVRQTIKISGINGIALTKLDVLDELDEIKICIAYELKGKKIDYLPAAVDDQIEVKPIYKTFKGWKMSTKGIKNFDELPKNAKIYVNELEKFIQSKVSSISTSPERNDTILIEDPFKN